MVTSVGLETTCETFLGSLARIVFVQDEDAYQKQDGGGHQRNEGLVVHQRDLASSSLSLRLQPEVHKPADGFRAFQFHVLKGDPLVNRSDFVLSPVRVWVGR
jgi:hypothetical protein